MTRLYVANCTKQTHVFCYRLDYSNTGEANANSRFQPARQQDIPPGQQRQIGGEMHMMQIEDIVKQHVKYGLVGVVDVPRLERRVAPLVFNVGIPVPSSVLEKVVNHNVAAQIDEGKTRRQKAAVASNELVQQTVAHKFVDEGIDQEPSKNMSIAVEQLEQSEAEEKMIAEGYRVDKNAPAAEPALAKARGKRRRGKN